VKALWIWKEEMGKEVIHSRADQKYSKTANNTKPRVSDAKQERKKARE
jgi:hypothetical protein